MKHMSKSGNLHYLIIVLIFTNCEGRINFRITGNILPIECNNMPLPSNITIRAHSLEASKNYHEMLGLFRNDQINSEDIVFLGNSLVFNGGDWARRLNCNCHIKNRGIPGDVTEGILNRLGEIVCNKPKSVFLEIGLNDIYYPWLTPQLIASNIGTIVYTIHQYSPVTEIYIQTILPTSSEKLNVKIRRTNDVLVNKLDNKLFHIIDLHPLFSDDLDLIKKELTTDGTHLTEEGYQVWVMELKKHLH